MISAIDKAFDLIYWSTISKPALMRACYRTFRKAMRQKKLFKPTHCQKCAKRHARIEGHHFNHRYPLQVLWVCQGCHKKIEAFQSLLTRTKLFSRYCETVGLDVEDKDMPMAAVKKWTDILPLRVRINMSRPKKTTLYEYWKRHEYRAAKKALRK